MSTSTERHTRVFRATEVELSTAALDPGDYIIMAGAYAEVVTLDRPTTLRGIADILKAREARHD